MKCLHLVFLPTIYMMLYVSTLDFVFERFIDEECFFEDVNTETQLDIQYHVIEGGFHDVDFKVINPNNAVIVHHKTKSSGELSINESIHGRYKFCFTNEHSSKASKHIVFSITPFHYLQNRKKIEMHNLNHTVTEAEKKQTEKFDSLMKSIIDLSVELAKVKRKQQFIEVKDMTVIKEYKRVGEFFLCWAIFEIGIVLCVALYQAFYFTRIFEVRRMI